MSGKSLPVLNQEILTKKQEFEKQAEDYWESAWKLESEKYTPSNSVLGQERIKRTEALLDSLPLDGKSVVDLGCGTAPLSSFLKTSNVTALDVSATALAKCPKHVKGVQQCLPYLRLPEEHFDLVLLTEVIAELQPQLYRLLLSEISFVMKKGGFFLCSTELDLYSEDPFLNFVSLVQTEFDLVEVKKSYHRLFFYLRRFLEAPSRFFRAGKNPDFRLRQLKKRKGFFRIWFFFNSMKGIHFFWRPFIFLKNYFHSRSALLNLERLSEFLWGEKALTHVIVLCKKKTLQKLN